MTAVHVTPVKQRRQAAHDEKGRQEDRHHREVRRVVQQRAEVEADAGRHEEHRDEEAEADRLELGPEAVVGHPAVLVQERQQPARGEGAEDDLEAQALGERDEGDHQDHRRPDADLGARVLEPQEVVLHPARVLRPAYDEERDSQQGDEHRQQDRGGARAALAGEEERQQDHSAEVRDRGGGEHELAELRLQLAEILEHGDDHPERGGAEDDRHQERRLDEPGRLEEERDRDGDRERHHPARERQPQEPAAQAAEVDLEAGEEEQHRQAHHGQHRDRVVDLHPAEHRWPDDDPGDDLEHDRREPNSREQPEQERRGEAHGHDDQEAGEPGLLHR